MKRRNRFVAHPRHPLTGKQFRVTGRTQAELDKLLEHIASMREEMRLDLVSEAEVDRKLRRVRYGVVKLSRVVESYARRKDLSPDTVERLRAAMRGPLRELVDLELDALEAPILSRLFERLSGEMAKTTLITTWRTLRALYRHAAERGWTARVPWGPWRPRARAGRPGRPLRECCRSERELEALIAAAATIDAHDLARAGGGYRALAPKIAAAAYLGLRQGEIAGLRLYDLYPERGTVGIRRQWRDDPIKGAIRAAEIEAPAELFALLERHLEIVGRPLGKQPVGEFGRAVFEQSSGQPYPRGSKPLPVDGLREAVRRAGLPNPSRWTPHSLRDTFATLEAQRQQPGDLAAIARRTRHATIESLLRYLRSFERASLAAPRQLAR